MLLTPLITLVVLSLCVLIHYELLIAITHRVARFEFSHRIAIVFGAIRAMLSHIIQVWVYAIGYWLLLDFGEGYGSIKGEPITGFLDWVYFSFVVYSTLGFGDMVPTGWVRFMVGTESITGLVMIAWTASFLFLELQKQWRSKK